MSLDEIKAIVEAQHKVCFLCLWIKKDIEENGKLTGWPYDYNHKSNFPPESKLLHLEVEQISVDNKK